MRKWYLVITYTENKVLERCNMETHKKKKKKKERKKERKQAVLDAVKFNRINLTLPPIPSPTSCRDTGLTRSLGHLMSQAQAPASPWGGESTFQLWRWRPSFQILPWGSPLNITIGFRWQAAKRLLSASRIWDTGLSNSLAIIPHLILTAVL